ncbi:hypothetical protein ACWC09_30275 [Streptomyces sp. NPDC001617]
MSSESTRSRCAFAAVADPQAEGVAVSLGGGVGSELALRHGREPGRFGRPALTEVDGSYALTARDVLVPLVAP